MDLLTTLSVLAFLGIIFLACRWRLQRPRELGEVSLVPYTGIMIICVVAFLALAAHAISLLTGKPLPAQGMGF